MKKIFAMAIIAASLVACDSTDSGETTIETSGTSTMSTTTTMSSTTAYTPAAGDATYRNGKLMVWRDNDWVEADEDVKMNNGVVVYKNGEVKKDGDVVVLEDGEVVSSTGEFFDETGHAVEKAWDATKKGVQKAGDAIEKAAEKTGDAIDGDNK